jgi:hypothetical protein
MRSRAWWLLAASLIAAFVARTPLYLSVLPPFEGWDEHQHLAYIVHLDQTGAIPVLDNAVVPRSLRPLFLSTPHSLSGAQQLQEWGALSYAEFWTTPRPADADREASFSFRLYQAQQPPLAYALAAPVWGAWKTTKPLEAIYAIRALNVLLVAVALLLFAGALTRLVPALGPRAAVLALVCVHPLFFQNLARVANDAVAVATGIAGISLLILADSRTLLSRGVLAAVCIAASVWSKQTSLTLIPVLIFGVPAIGWAHRVAAGRVWRASALAALTFVLLVAPLWWWTYQRYGLIVTTQDSVELAARGSVLSALAASLVSLDWLQVVKTLFVPGTPWAGGWSYLPVLGTLSTVYGWCWGALVVAAGAGAIMALRRARSAEGTDPIRADRVAPTQLAICAAVVICTTLGMAYYTVLSNAVFGRWMTNPWYFMTALPFVFVLLVRGLEVIDVRLAIAGAALLAVLYVGIDLHGTLVQMPAAYTNTTDGVLRWSRLSAMRPAILSGELRWVFLALQLVALALFGAALVYARKTRT